MKNTAETKEETPQAEQQAASDCAREPGQLGGPVGNGAGCDMGLKLRPPVKACRQKLAASNIFTKARTLTGWDQSELSAYVADRCPGYAGSTRSWRYWEAGGEPSIDVYLVVRGLVEEHEGKRRVG